jgi:predicted ATPase
MYLNQLSITNYKSFLNPKVFNFEPGFNVLIGANSSGKTSVLEAIAIHEFQNTPHRSILNAIEIDTVLTDASTVELRFVDSFDEFRKQVPHSLPIHIGLGSQNGHFYEQNVAVLEQLLIDKPLCLDFKIDHAAGRFSRISFTDWPSMWRSLGASAVFPALQVTTSPITVPVSNFGVGSNELDQLYGRTTSRIYKFSAERAVQASCGPQPTSELQPGCSNLAYCINYLSASNPDLFKKLNGLLHRVFPMIHWIAAPPNGSGLFELKVHTNPTIINRGELAVPINRVGTGVGNALAMLYVVLTAQTQKLILLDEPNSFLHPRALRELLAILAEIGAKHQFFITTHSSDVLRTINAATVSLLEHDGQQTTIKQTTGSKLHELRAGLIDLGIRLTDLHGCDEVIWVEGETEEAIFPKLLRHYFPEQAQGVAVLPLHSTGDFESKKIKTKK